MNLPLPDPTAKAHSDTLICLIRDEIQKNQGIIGFDHFMKLALYAPGLGYYSAGSRKFGDKGDFVTAPEISPLFAACIAKQCQQVLAHLPSGSLFELGAGTGIFAQQIMLELEKLHTLPEKYLILETSADLRERQQARLKAEIPHLFARFEWLDTLPAEKISGVIFANEVLDALPVHCFHVKNDTLYERCVTLEKNHFEWILRPPILPELQNQFHQLQADYSLPNGYESEINLQSSAWITSLEKTLKQGVLLLFDYGYGRREYYHSDRSQGTLMCYYQHHKHADPFILVGLQDITAHVDFTSIAETTLTTELKLSGYTTQSSFLLACGLLEIAQSHSLSETALFQQNQAIKILTLPSQMGEAIKAIGLTKNFDIPLLGFSLHDRRRDL
jgi:SAM-dependent MidA family methyltransferase